MLNFAMSLPVVNRSHGKRSNPASAIMALFAASELLLSALNVSTYCDGGLNVNQKKKTKHETQVK